MKNMYLNFVRALTMILAFGWGFSANAQYCTPTYDDGCGWGDQIDNFSLVGETITLINNDAECPSGTIGYSDFTSMNAPDLIPGETYSGTIGSYGWDLGVRIWIDFNGDEIFDEDETIYFSSGDDLGISDNYSFTVPYNAVGGTTRMRVRLEYYLGGPFIQPCGHSPEGYGETHDYSVEIQTLSECSGQPSAGIIQNGDFAICADRAFTLTVIGATSADGMQRQWQVSTDGGANWNDIAGASNTTLNVTAGINAETSYRFYVLCENGGDDEYSAPITVSIKPTNECYCVPSSIYSDYISSFVTTGGTTNINLTDLNEMDYHDYTATETVSVAVAGGSFDFTSAYVGGSSTMMIWVDWNENGQFDSNEALYNYYGSSPHSGTITVPLEIPAGSYVMRVRARWGTGALSPCGAADYGSAFDFTLVVEESAEACSGNPTIGAVDPIAICPDQSVTLNATGLDEGILGITYQWQISEDGGATWTDISGATTIPYTLSSGVDAGDMIQLVATCTDTQDETTESITVTASPANQCYCIPAGMSTSYYINNFSTTGGVTNIENTGTGYSTSGYGNFTNLSVSQLQGESIAVNGNYVGTTFGTKIWVDWNQDGIFDEVTEVVYASTSYTSTLSANITVPLTALPGNTRMRIGISSTPSTGPANPCMTDLYGEYEDYTFNVIALPDCVGDPDAGTLVDREVCSGVAFTLSSTGVTVGFSGLNYQWQISDDGSTWTNILGATTASYVYSDGISSPKFFRLSAECDFGTETVYSNTMEVTIKPEQECPCIPVATNASYFISSFTTSNGIQNISNPNSGFSTGGYGDFTIDETGQSVEQMLSLDVSFNAVFSENGYTYGFKIWVDWNQNGTFEANEAVWNSNGYASSHNGTFTVPTDALPGVTRMRIANHYLNSSGDIDPCATNHTYGEFEDYTFIVVTIDGPTIEQAAGTPDCISGTNLTLSGTLDSGQAWYWQTEDNGTSTDHDGDDTWTVYQNGTYYARIFDSNYNIWSETTAYTVTNIPESPAPTGLAADENPVCLPGTEIHVDQAPSGQVYYWQESEMGTSMDDNAEDAIFLSETSTYYVRGYDPVTQCWSEAVSITVEVNENIPPTPIAAPNSYFYCAGATTAEISAIAGGSGDGAIYESPYTDGGNGCGAGVFFNVKNDEVFDIKITGFDVRVNTSGTQNLAVYHKNGTYLGATTDPGAWTQLGSYPIQATSGALAYTATDDLIIPAGATYGIFLNYNAAYTTLNANTTDTDGSITVTYGDGSCTIWTATNPNRGFNGNIHYAAVHTPQIVWYDAETGGSVVAIGDTIETVGTIVMPTPVNGTYEFWAEADLGGCTSLEREKVTVNITNVKVDLGTNPVTCNNGNDGEFFIENVECGTLPFTYSVDGGDFATATGGLTPGNHTVVVKDADDELSGVYTITIGNAPEPSNLVVDAYAHDFIDVSWTGNGAETQWNIQWGNNAFVPGIGTPIGTDITNDPFYTITGLNPSTSYKIYVSAYCGAENEPGDWISITQATTCAPATALGFCEDFETTPLGCWLVFDKDGNGETFGVWYSSETGGLGYNSEQAGGLDLQVNPSTNDDYIVLPQMMLTGNEIMTYYERLFTNGSANYEVLISMDGVQFDNLDVLYTGQVNGTQWVQRTINLSDYTGPAFIMLHVGPGATSGAYILFDDVCIDICIPDPSTGIEKDVCVESGTFNLSTAVNSPYNHGVWSFPANENSVTGNTFDVSNIAGGSYDLIYLVTTACTTDTTHTTINVFEPSSAGLGSTIQVCKNEPINLYSALSGSVDMGGQWYDYLWNPTSSQPSAPNLPAEYNFRYVVDNGVCGADTAIVVVQVKATCDWLNIVEESFEEISIYPNPTTDYINIVNPSNTNGLIVEVMDMNGRIILTDNKSLNNVNEASINIEYLARGIYTLRVYNDLGQKVFKVIKQ